MMDKEFDFSSVGKKMPYTVQENFFEDATLRTLVVIRKRKRNRVLRRIVGVAASVILICGLSFTFFDSGSPSVDEVITQMSDSELEALVSFSENDLLFNEEL